VLGDLLYQLGSILGSLGGLVTGEAGTAFDNGGREVAVYDTETGEVHGGETGDGVDPGQAMAGALTAWLVARLLRPREVSWPRVILAGIAATALADLVGRSVEDEDAAPGTPYAEDPEELMARFAAGVAVAAGYASLLYPRLPGSPLFRGLTFGALEMAAAPRGGLAALASSTPGIRYPLQALALPVDEDAGPLSHVAFGLGLGLFYRYGAARHDDEGDD
jgi:hypothetical protein